ncbi:hypothetical protein HPT25_27920 [Bacillus sp. BRMEA1]|uniref:hypothetical protein n=1 Tax=Neobacillus endophyticus TaxID=2738405 RepID=UPI0015658558|nr:hypothetical protein [Neobacillus endophyticus]NRD81122.1 hypothetical protein [Neobacillus endophyticus]
MKKPFRMKRKKKEDGVIKEGVKETFWDLVLEGIGNVVIWLIKGLFHFIRHLFH